MFNFFYAALQQQGSGNAVKVVRYRPGKKTVCVRFALGILCGTALLLAGHYGHLLYSAWFAESPPVVERPYKPSTQRYFYKKQPLPEAVEAIESETALPDDTQPDEVDIEPPEPDNRADLRERVEQAIKELQP